MNFFKIITPCYNVEKYISNVVKSVLCQTYTNFEMVIINDNSNDNTKNILQQVNDNRIKIINNDCNIGALANTVKGINYICNNEQDIIVILDGDDFLADGNVLQKLNIIYSDSFIWATYGNYKSLTTNIPRRSQLLTSPFNRKLREHSPSHLRTYKKFIFDNIKNEDLLDENGNYYKITGDFAITFPVMELAGKHVKCIDDVLYIYNDENPLNDYKKDLTKQENVEFILRNKTPYEEILR